MTRGHRTKGKQQRGVAQPPPAVSQPDALAIAIARNDWERAALLLALGLSLAARSLPDETIDDLLALLERDDPMSSGEAR